MRAHRTSPVFFAALLGLALPTLVFAGSAARKSYPTNASPNRPAASSVAFDDTGDHSPDFAFDGLLVTGWGEGAPGNGEGAYLEIDLGGMTELQSFSIWPGNLREGNKSYREYGRPRTIQIMIDGKAFGEPQRRLDELTRWDIPLSGKGRKIRLNIVDSYEGAVFTDMYIAEACVNYVQELAKPDPRVEKWLASPQGKSVAEKYANELDARFQAHKKAEFGDPESLAWIMGAAADGPYFLRPEVQKIVPAGERAAALRPDTQAINALRRLKDPNGIPAIEAAGLKAVGKEKEKLKELIEIFYAYQELIGGADPNVPYWGKKGWADGAIQSFGEPVGVAVDRFGFVYIADIGNNRVQRFNEEGRPDKIWGSPTDITDQWFKKGRKWYVSGSAPGADPGMFSNPLDIVMIPEKEGEGFAVLDALGRVQLYTAEGKNRISWSIHTDRIVEPRLGGQGYLAWLPAKKQIWVFFSDEAIGFNLNGEEIGRFDIKDGPPNAVAVTKAGRFLLAFGGEIVQYEQGFRFGAVITEKDLISGYEDIALATDAKGAIWVLVDKGWAFKFSKPGKLELKVKVTDYAMDKQRFAVRDNILFISERDRILKVDALQVKLDAEEKAKEDAQNALLEGGAPPQDTNDSDDKKKKKKGKKDKEEKGE